VATEQEKKGQQVDLDAVAKLVEAMERDLQKIGGDSSEIRRLRDEVETLRNVLRSPVRRQHWVRDALHAIRDAAVAEGLRDSQYIAEIGRILGM